MVEKEEENKGITWRSLSGILYAAIVLQPAFLWLYFATGSLMSWAAMYTTALLFSELARLTNNPLRKQEIFVIMYGSTVAVAEALIFTTPIYNAYYRTSPIAARFGLTNLIPNWIVPPPNSPAIVQRTLFHIDWLTPLILLFAGSFLAKGADIALGFLTRELYIKIEKLPFPMQNVDAEVCRTLAVKESEKIKIFTFSALVAMAYATLLYALPIVSYATRGQSTVVIPQPWVDMNKWVGSLVPGASFGIATDMTQFAMGFILPFEVVVSMFLGSFAFYFIGNAVLVHFGMFEEWFPGMSLMTTWERSILYFWASPIVGLLVAAALLPIIRHPGNIVRAFKDLMKIPAVAKKRGSVSLKAIMLIYLASTLGSVAIVWFLVPGFRSFVWLLILLSVGWTFIYTIASARSIGVTGMGIVAPFSSSLFAKEAAFIASGYQGVDIWFAPLVVSSGGATWCALFKVADLTDTNPREYIKAYFFAVAVAYVMGFLYISAFWSMAPIPSSLFPCPAWPVNALMQSLFITRNLELLKPQMLFGAGLVGAILFVLIELVHLPLSLIGLALGPTVAIPFTLSYFIGAIIARIFERKLGKEWFQTYRSVMVAGIFTGEGFVIAVSTAIALIAKSTWALPF